MHVARSEIIVILRSRGLLDRADWVQRDLPPVVDTDKNAALLRMLDIDVTSMSPVDVSQSSG
jgi:hypothetical protein